MILFKLKEIYYIFKFRRLSERIIIIIDILPSYLAAELLLVYHKVNYTLLGQTKPLYTSPCIHKVSLPSLYYYLASLTADYIIQPQGLLQPSFFSFLLVLDSCIPTGSPVLREAASSQELPYYCPCISRVCYYCCKVIDSSQGVQQESPLEYLSLLLQFWAVEDYIGQYLSCNTIVVEQCIYLRDPLLEQEYSEPYLTSTDLYKKGALILLKVLVFLEYLLPFEFRVYIYQLYTRSFLGPCLYLDLTFLLQSLVPLYYFIYYQLPFSILLVYLLYLLLSSFRQELQSYRLDSCLLPSEVGYYYSIGTMYLPSYTYIFEPSLELYYSIIKVYIDQ